MNYKSGRFIWRYVGAPALMNCCRVGDIDEHRVAQLAGFELADPGISETKAVLDILRGQLTLTFSRLDKRYSTQAAFADAVNAFVEQITRQEI